MDPDVTLQEIREMVAEVLASQAPDSESDEDRLARLELSDRRLFELAGAVENLDGWMSKGGHRPGAWRETEDHR